MKTSAAVLHKMYLERPYTTSRPLRIEEVELDTPGFNEVVVKIKAAGLCHSDLSVINGNRPRPLPMVLGHEAAGVVIELGDGVKKLKVGDHVVFAFYHPVVIVPIVKQVVQHYVNLEQKPMEKAHY